jgi:hypothetical protein
MHASVPEILWTIVAVAGVAIHLRGAAYAVGDRRAVIVEDGDVALRMIATGRLRGEVIRSVVDVGFAAVGVYAMTQPDPPRPWTPGAILLTSVLIGCVALLVVNAALDDRERALLRERVRAATS